MRESGDDPVDDHFGFGFVLRSVLAEEIQDEDLGPLHTFVDGDEDSTQQDGIHFDVLFSGDHGNFLEGGDGIGQDEGVRLLDYNIFEDGDEVGRIGVVGCDFVDLWDAEDGSFPDVGVFVVESLFEGIDQILVEFGYSEGAHGPDGEGSDDGICFIVSVFSEKIYGHDGVVGSAAGVVDGVEVDLNYELSTSFFMSRS